MSRRLVLSFISVGKTLETAEDFDDIVQLPFGPTDTNSDVASKLNKHIGAAIVEAYFKKDQLDMPFHPLCFQAWVKDPKDSSIQDLKAWFLAKWEETSNLTGMSPEELLKQHGICEVCGQMYSHDIDSPHASCACRTSEWYELTPYMLLEKRLYEIAQLARPKESG